MSETKQSSALQACIGALKGRAYGMDGVCDTAKLDLAIRAENNFEAMRVAMLEAESKLCMFISHFEHNVPDPHGYAEHAKGVVDRLRMALATMGEPT